jgi:hypothetical protein
MAVTTLGVPIKKTTHPGSAHGKFEMKNLCVLFNLIAGKLLAFLFTTSGFAVKKFAIQFITNPMCA